jgi:hypothetical protein
MDNSDIERRAIKAVESLEDTGRITTYLNKGDKEPIWDGNLYFYRTLNNKSNENMIGKIPTQIKGREVKNFSNKDISYSLKIDHLLKYKDDGGIVFFVVEIIQEGGFKIFCKSLLPLDIDKILNNKKIDKKTIKVYFKPLENPVSFFENFLLNKPKQGGEARLKINEADSILRFATIHSATLYEDFSRIMLDEAYLYGKLKQVKGIIPIDKLRMLDLLEDDENLKEKLDVRKISGLAEDSKITISIPINGLQISFTNTKKEIQSIILITNTFLNKTLHETDKMSQRVRFIVGVNSIKTDIIIEKSNNFSIKIIIEDKIIITIINGEINFKISNFENIHSFLKKLIESYDKKILNNISFKKIEVRKIEDNLYFESGNPLIFEI